MAEIEALNPIAIVISPGPGRPEEAALAWKSFKNLIKPLPILGICLGHQAIGAAFGGKCNGC